MALIRTGSGKGSRIIFLGTGRSFDLKTLLPNDYTKLTSDNFIVEMNTGAYASVGVCSRDDGGGASAVVANKTYDPNTGVLSISNAYVTVTIAEAWGRNPHTGTANWTPGVYVVLGDIETL